MHKEAIASMEEAETDAGVDAGADAGADARCSPWPYHVWLYTPQLASTSQEPLDTSTRPNVLTRTGLVTLPGKPPMSAINDGLRCSYAAKIVCPEVCPGCGAKGAYVLRIAARNNL